ncbi:hypothetical protein P3L10_016137 [Capsicum annuum]
MGHSLLNRSFYYTLFILYSCYTFNYFVFKDLIAFSCLWLIQCGIAILRDIMQELQTEVHNLQWELAAVRVRMLREIRRLRKVLLLPVEDWPAGHTNNNDDNNN